MTPDEIAAVLALHTRWLDGENDGVRANLRDADLWDANLRDANLRGANLRGANLRGADLRDADLDFSAFPFWCGAFGVRVDARIAAQLAYHFCRLEIVDCPEGVAAQAALRELANRFHRGDECGVIPDGGRLR